MVPYIIGGVLVLVVLAIAGYFFARYMKGKLDLQLSRDTAASGEALAGQVMLEAKKEIRGLLKVSLVGREKQTRRARGSSNEDTTEWVETYRDDKILEETRKFEPGFMQTYEFEITAPTSAQARRGGAILRQAAENAGEGMMGDVVKMAAGVADMMQGRIHWHIETRLDADGVDLFHKEKVDVNLRD